MVAEAKDGRRQDGIIAYMFPTSLFRVRSAFELCFSANVERLENTGIHRRDDIYRAV